jgi:hypothetical protein
VLSVAETATCGSDVPEGNMGELLPSTAGGLQPDSAAHCSDSGNLTIPKAFQMESVPSSMALTNSGIPRARTLWPPQRLAAPPDQMSSRHPPRKAALGQLGRCPTWAGRAPGRRERSRTRMSVGPKGTRRSLAAASRATSAEATILPSPPPTSGSRTCKCVAD